MSSLIVTLIVVGNWCNCYQNGKFLIFSAEKLWKLLWLEQFYVHEKMFLVKNSTTINDVRSFIAKQTNKKFRNQIFQIYHIFIFNVYIENEYVIYLIYLISKLFVCLFRYEASYIVYTFIVVLFLTKKCFLFCN